MFKLDPLWEQKAMEQQTHAQNTKAHIGKMLEDGCTYIPAIAYNSDNGKFNVLIVKEENDFIDSNGDAWDAAYPVNIYGNPMSLYEYERMKYDTLKDNGLKHSK